MTAVDEYISKCPAEHQERLHSLYQVIKQAAPQLQEKIAYGMPAFYLKRNVIYFALNKHHIGLYPTPLGVEAFRDRLAPYKTSKGAVQLPHDQPLPLPLIHDMTVWCAENLGE
ncbi:MAG: hypothetical protein GXZ04_00690 [Clostridiales bacterium]|nr:hypothetical protein [Clostridiales bacterium]